MASLAFLQQAGAWSSRGLLRRTTRTTFGSCLFSSSAATEQQDTTTVHGRQSLANVVTSMDVKTIVAHTDLVLSHLKSRRASEDTQQAAQTIASLQSKRVALIQERDDYQIGRAHV